MTFRQVLFWLHLIAGVIAGLVIAVMCFTGAALAFESEIVSWAERDARVVTPPAGAARLPLQELLARVREEEPDSRPTGITVSSDPRDAVVFALGREGAIYANPYTGELRRPASTKVHDFLHGLEDWHRTLAMGGDRRPIGKLINGCCNVAFCFLALTGVYLWFPRSWSWRSVRSGLFFNGKLSGKARDFNWHNVIGLWSAPVLIVLTLTAIPMSFRWGANLIYQIAGETPPATPAPGTAGPGPGAGAPAVEVPAPPPGTRRLDYDALLVATKKETPDWEQLTFRLGNGGPRGGNAAQAARPAEGAPRENRGGTRPAQAVTVTVKQTGQWPRTATTTLTFNPYTGDVLKREGYADQSAARRIRSWTRFLHTGQALGWVGQFVALVACLGGCVLVYTGFALAVRRFLAWRKKPAQA